MLHPVIPFVTEAIWAELNKAAAMRGLREVKAGEPVMVAAAWPKTDASLRDEALEAQMSDVQDVIRSVRDIRTVVNDFRGRAKQPSLRTLPSVTVRATPQICELLTRFADFLRPLAGCDTLHVAADADKPAGAMSRVCGGVQVYAPVADLVDLAEVRRTDEARLNELRGVLSRESSRLANEDFIRRADPGIVEQARARAAELSEQIRMLESHLSEIG